MAEGSCHIKQEIDTTCCSPTTSLTMQKKSSNSSSCIKANNIVTSNCNGHNYTVQEVILKSSPSVSPERQLCSSTTSVSGDMVCATSDGKMNATGNSSTSLVMRDELRRLCLVCGDVASGFHYGVASCEACKAFFKRTIQGNIEYTCPANNECEINKRRRKACQACRFQKCLLMGMLKEGVRLDRVRGGRQKYRRNPVSNTYQTMQMLFQSSTSSLDDIKILEVLNTYEPDAISTQSEGGGGGGTNLNVSSTAADETDTGKTGSSSSSSKSCMFNIKTCYADPHDILCVISDIYDKELVGVIGWAKQIPGFTDLILDDQMKLLQVSWAEILTLQLTYRSVPFNGRLHFATDVWMDEAIAQECGATEFYYHCVKIAQRLERLSARKEEYYLLKALALSNCDILLEDQSSLRIFRDSIMNSLNDCVYLLRHSAAVSHQQQLLLLLPALRQADNILRRFWRNVFREGIVTMKKLFIEMLDTPLR